MRKTRCNLCEHTVQILSMSLAHKIIGRFGGTHATARALGIPPTTVQSWKDSGTIPARHHQRILEKSRALETPLTPDDFFDLGDDPLRSTSCIRSMDSGAAK
jgi:hypothetical protein